MSFNVQPHGGDQLVDLMVGPDEAEELKHVSGTFPSITLSQRQLCDLELLMNGAFTPLTGFMGRESYESVLDSLSLPDGTMW
ncbi:MAG: adenylyltransferase, partial [Sedimenticolaceae bacterium]